MDIYGVGALLCILYNVRSRMGHLVSHFAVVFEDLDCVTSETIVTHCEYSHLLQVLAQDDLVVL
jgi:hypothetical protein